MENLIIAIIIWHMLGILINTFIFAISNEDGKTFNVWVTPKDVYNTTHMNWFGAIMTYLIMFIINPLWYLIKLIWWICHVGR